MPFPFHIFGSGSSLDYDIVLFVTQLGTTKQNRDVCEEQALWFNNFFEQKSLPVKKINLNMAVLANGVIERVYKGTPDELNNAVLQTYTLHTQHYPLLITQRVERNWQLKMIRACRTMLSFYSRTTLRASIKQALHGDLDAKMTVLEQLDFARFTQLDKTDPRDCWKTIAFQLGQGMGLLQGVELYTKEEIESAFPELGVFLRRRTIPADLARLELQKQRFLEMLKSVRPQFTKLTEQEWMDIK